jgi:hypothetical protein
MRRQAHDTPVEQRDRIPVRVVRPKPPWRLGQVGISSVSNAARASL